MRAAHSRPRRYRLVVGGRLSDRCMDACVLFAFSFVR